MRQWVVVLERLPPLLPDFFDLLVWAPVLAFPSLSVLHQRGRPSKAAICGNLERLVTALCIPQCGETISYLQVTL